MYQLTGVFLFTARLARSGVFGDLANIEIRLRNLENGVLDYTDDGRFPLCRDTCATPTTSCSVAGKP